MDELLETRLTDETALERLHNTATWLQEFGEFFGCFKVFAQHLQEIREYLKNRLQEKAGTVIKVSPAPMLSQGLRGTVTR